MDDDKKYPSQAAERFQIRMPDGLRDRIRIAAERNNRSMNAEIVNALESAFPVPITIDDNIADIRATMDVLRQFPGNSTLMVLADELDYLIARLIGSPEASEDAKTAAKNYLETNAKFSRFVPPDEDR